MELNRQTIVEFIRRNREHIRTFGVVRIGLFGSFARNEQRSDSDVDLLVDYDQGKATFRNLMNLAFFFEDAFQRKIELITPASLSDRLKQYIAQEIEYVALTD